MVEMGPLTFGIVVVMGLVGWSAAIYYYGEYKYYKERYEFQRDLNLSKVEEKFMMGLGQGIVTNVSKALGARKEDEEDG